MITEFRRRYRMERTTSKRVVAGDHANNDMAGAEEDSWKSMFEAAGCFDSVTAQIAGLGSIEAVQNLYVAHTRAVIDTLN